MNIERGLANLDAMLRRPGGGVVSDEYVSFTGWGRELRRIEEAKRQLGVIDQNDQARQQLILRELDKLSLHFTGKGFLDLCQTEYQQLPGESYGMRSGSGGNVAPGQDPHTPRAVQESGARGKDAVEIFYSYSHRDERFREELEKHLSVMRRQGVISDWHDRKISAGKEWEMEISEYMDRAQVILLLVSADFLASDYCYDVEMQRALERHEQGEARVIPIILRECDWRIAPFGKLQALPKDAKPITSWADRDKAFTDVTQGIRAAVEQLRH
jgi:hypothetical protein